MNPRTLAKRLREARSRRETLLQHRLITVRFTLNYDQLVAHVAHALRAYVVYRTDGGNFARGLISISSNLREIYYHYKLHRLLSEGEALALESFLTHRKDPAPMNRWRLSLEFFPFFKDVECDVEETEPAKPKKHVQEILDRAAVIASTIPGGTVPGDRARRIM